jgi:hypothetical protein
MDIITKIINVLHRAISENNYRNFHPFSIVISLVSIQINRQIETEIFSDKNERIAVQKFLNKFINLSTS